MRATPEIENTAPPRIHPLQTGGTPAASPAVRGGAAAPAWAALLHQFYRRQNLPLPRMTRVPPDGLPRPYRRLLAHCNDMTPTLEAFHGAPLALRVVQRETTPEVHAREVVLAISSAGPPVAYGAICIHLDQFEAPVRQRILEEREPFGAVLQAEAIAHLCWPQAFLQVQADDRMRHLLQLPRSVPLYGRRNVVLDGQRRLLAEVIEILAPAPKSST